MADNRMLDKVICRGDIAISKPPANANPLSRNIKRGNSGYNIIVHVWLLEIHVLQPIVFFTP